MHSARLLRGIAALVALLLAATVVLQAPTARAAANAPRWTAGDYWLFTNQDSNPVRWTVVAKEPVTLIAGTYDTWHLTETRTTGAISVTLDSWVRDADLGIAKETALSLLGTVTYTYDPPKTQADFPLTAGKEWSKQAYQETWLGGTRLGTGTLPYTAKVEGETDIAVPAGTFHVFVIRTPAPSATAVPYTKLYYAESVGYWVKREAYDAQDDPTGERISLVEYKYQSGAMLTTVLIALVVIAIVAVLLFLWLKRRQAVGKPGGPRGPSQPPVIPRQPP